MQFMSASLKSMETRLATSEMSMMPMVMGSLIQR